MAGIRKRHRRVVVPEASDSAHQLPSNFADATLTPHRNLCSPICSFATRLKYDMISSRFPYCEDVSGVGRKDG